MVGAYWGVTDWKWWKPSYVCLSEVLYIDLDVGQTHAGASMIAKLVKNPPSMQETLVQFLGQEDPLEKR